MQVRAFEGYIPLNKYTFSIYKANKVVCVCMAHSRVKPPVTTYRELDSYIQVYLRCLIIKCTVKPLQIGHSEKRQKNGFQD